MKGDSIRKYLRPQPAVRRSSTVTNILVSALAPYDQYDAESARQALCDLGQDPDGDLQCVYCGGAAATWDHLNNRVRAGCSSGHGHTLRNLVPSCRTCNERKGAKSWREWLGVLAPSDAAARALRLERFEAVGQTAAVADDDPEIAAALARFEQIRRQIFDLMAESDKVAERIRMRRAGMC